MELVGLTGGELKGFGSRCSVWLPSAPFEIVKVGDEAGLGTLVGADIVDLVEVHDKRVVRLEGVIAVVVVGVAAGIGTAAVVRSFKGLRCAVGFTRGFVCRGGWRSSIAGATVRGVALSVVEGKVGFEMVGVLMVVCVVGEVALVMRGCTLLALFYTVYATLKVAIWGHVSGLVSTGPENTSESSRYQLPCVNLRATACRWFVSTRECTPALSRALDLLCITLVCTVLI